MCILFQKIQPQCLFSKCKMCKKCAYSSSEVDPRAIFSKCNLCKKCACCQSDSQCKSCEYGVCKCCVPFCSIKEKCVQKRCDDSRKPTAQHKPKASGVHSMDPPCQGNSPLFIDARASKSSQSTPVCPPVHQGAPRLHCGEGEAAIFFAGPHQNGAFPTQDGHCGDHVSQQHASVEHGAQGYDARPGPSHTRAKALCKHRHGRSKRCFKEQRSRSRSPLRAEGRVRDAFATPTSLSTFPIPMLPSAPTTPIALSALVTPTSLSAGNPLTDGRTRSNKRTRSGARVTSAGIPGSDVHAVGTSPVRMTSLPPNPLAQCLEQWKKCNLCAWMQRTITRGYKLQFSSKPPMSDKVLYTHASGQAAEVLRQEILSLLSKGAIQEVTSRQPEVTGITLVTWLLRFLPLLDSVYSTWV